MGKSEWRLEPEGEAEVPEISIVSDAVESTKVDFDGKSHREQAEERFSRREREVPSEGGEEIKKSKKSDSSGIRRNAGLRKRSKECGTGRSGRDEFRAKCA